MVTRFYAQATRFASHLTDKLVILFSLGYFSLLYVLHISVRLKFYDSIMIPF